MKLEKDWYRLRTLTDKCDPCVMFGITSKAGVQDYIYPDRSPKRGSTVIWNPEKGAHVSIGTYVEVSRGTDEAAKEKLRSIGVPPGIDFGYRPGDDMSSTYEVRRKPRAKKADSVKVMRAAYAAEFEDGGRFRAGDVVRIVFRKKFVRDSAGVKKFRNVYERPSKEELDAFLESEAKGE